MNRPKTESAGSIQISITRCTAEAGFKCPAVGSAGLGLFPDLPGESRPGESAQNRAEDYLGPGLHYV